MVNEEEALLQAEFDEEKTPVKLGLFLENMKEISGRLGKIQVRVGKIKARLDRIERFLQRKFLEEWDSYV